MTRDQMLRYIDDPSMLNERTLGELREILDEYPYFHSAHLLYIRNLQIESNFRFSGQLKSSAVYVTDRSILYHLLNPGPEKKQSTDYSLEIRCTSGQDGHPLIELSDDLPEQRIGSEESKKMIVSNVEIPYDDLLNFDLPANGYALEGVDNDLEKPLSEVVKEISALAIKKGRGKESEQKADLIDRFIKDNPAFTVRQTVNGETDEKSETKIKSNGDNDEFITETLARIYVNQGLYTKAISAFEKLSLKYPEKSVYFARQIEEVTNLLNK